MGIVLFLFVVFPPQRNPRVERGSKYRYVGEQSRDLFILFLQVRKNGSSFVKPLPSEKRKHPPVQRVDKQ